MRVDKIVKALLYNGSVSLTAIDATQLVSEAKAAHGTSAVCTAALGRVLMATAMMGTKLKNETDSVTAIIKGDGPAGNLVCVGYPDGRVKGYVANPHIELEPNAQNKLDVCGALGRSGSLTVIRDLSLKEPYVGQVDLVSGEVGEDFAKYFLVSEQQPSLVYLGVRVHTQTLEVRAAGGAIIQPLPDCEEDIITMLEAKAQDVATLAKRLDDGESLVMALEAIFGHIDILEENIPRYSCDCTRERVERILISLGEDELRDMIAKENGAELTCQFCNTSYNFDALQLQALIDEIAARREE